jgi:hypothetical protein
MPVKSGYDAATSHYDDAVNDVTRELFQAIREHPFLNSPHEGWAVIREELDELWDHVRANTGRTSEARSEAIQVAAMALRYAVELTESDRKPEP